MEYVIIEKLIELIREIFTTEIDDEILYPIDEYRYNDNDYEILD